MPAIFFNGENYSAVSSAKLTKAIDRMADASNNLYSLIESDILTFGGFKDVNTTPVITKYKDHNWSTFSDIEVYRFGAVIEFNGEIHVLGNWKKETSGDTTSNKHYKLTFNLSGEAEWTEVGTLPTSIAIMSGMQTVVSDNKIYLLNMTNLYVYNGDTGAWSTLTTPEPSSSDNNGSCNIISIAVCKGELYALTEYNDNVGGLHSNGLFKLVDSSWQELISPIADKSTHDYIFPVTYMGGGRLFSINDTLYFMVLDHYECSVNLEKVLTETKVNTSDRMFKIVMSEQIGSSSVSYDYRVVEAESLPYKIGLNDEYTTFCICNNEIHVLNHVAGDEPIDEFYSKRPEKFHLKYNEEQGWVKLPWSDGIEISEVCVPFEYDGNICAFGCESIYSIPDDSERLISAYLSKDTVVAFNNLESDELGDVTNATKLEDGISFKVTENGIVTAQIKSSKELKYTIV